MTTEPKIAKTWKECAQHVGAGGVVAGDVQFLQKPFDVATLARKIRAVLDS